MNWGGASVVVGGLAAAFLVHPFVGVLALAALAFFMRKS